jgi:hypothetical protein
VKEFTGLTMELLIPGAMVNARVRAVLKDGLLLSFLTYFMGTVSSQFLLSPLLLFCSLTIYLLILHVYEHWFEDIIGITFLFEGSQNASRNMQR